MAAVDSSRYEELCRLCATKTTLLSGVHLFQSQGLLQHLGQKIESCLSLQVHETDELPKMLCQNCIYKLNMLFDFKDRTKRTERLLIDLFREINAMKLQSRQDLNEHIIMVPEQPIHELPVVDDLDLSQLGAREQLIVGHEIILTQGDLESISLNQNLQTQDPLMEETGNEIQNSSYGDDNLGLIHHQQILQEQFSIDRVDEEDMSLGADLDHAVGQKLKENLDQNTPAVTYPAPLSPETDIPPNPPPINKKHHNDHLYILKSDNTAPETPEKEWQYCSICGKPFKDEPTCEAHYETHFEQCTLCSAYFPSRDLGTHRKLAHPDVDETKVPIKTRLKRATLPMKREDGDDTESEESGTDFIDEVLEDDDLEKLAVDSNTKKKFAPKTCKECGKTYKTNYKLNEHMRKHTGEKPYKCDSCEKEFRSKIGLAQHAAKHTGKYDFSCSTCGKGFQCKSYLMVHQRVHSDLKPYPCTTCGRDFKTKQSLLDHTNRHLGLKPYMCDVCGRGFITKGLCKAHQKVHTGLDNRKYSCKVCNKMFVSKSYLQTHLRIHTGEKPFICEVCDKGFLTKVDLKIHTTMHTGEKSFVCEICGKAFARRDALRCHRRSHTGERPYSCDLCGQTFTQFTPMAIHKRLHTGERPYSCETCGKGFVSRSTMMSHAKKHSR